MQMCIQCFFFLIEDITMEIKKDFAFMYSKEELLFFSGGNLCCCYEWELGIFCVNCLPGVWLHVSHYCSQCNSFKRGRMKMDQLCPSEQFRELRFQLDCTAPQFDPYIRKGLTQSRAASDPTQKGTGEVWLITRIPTRCFRSGINQHKTNTFRENNQKLWC